MRKSYSDFSEESCNAISFFAGTVAYWLCRSVQIFTKKALKLCGH